MRIIDHYAKVFAYTVYVLRNRSKPELDGESVRAAIDVLLEQAKDGCDRAGVSPENINHATFAVISWIDESLINSSWAGSRAWQRNSLQRSMFHTSNAGREFYERLHHLHQDARELREVYEYCLALGFRGKYYRREDENDRLGISAENLRYITGEANVDYPGRLFPEAYAGVDNAPTRRKHRLSFFTLVTMVVPVGIFAGLYLLYFNILRTLIDNLFSG